jgi:hypothetical protein
MLDVTDITPSNIENKIKEILGTDLTFQKRIFVVLNKFDLLTEKPALESLHLVYVLSSFLL